MVWFIESYNAIRSESRVDIYISTMLSEFVKEKLLVVARKIGKDVVSFMLNGIQTVSNERILELIEEYVKADSVSDFQLKMRKLKFPDLPEKYLPNASNFPIFYEKLLIYRNKFEERLKILCNRTDRRFVPGLKGRDRDKDPGLIDLFLEKIPYSRGYDIYHDIDRTSMDSINHFDAFLNVFYIHLDKLNSDSIQTKKLERLMSFKPKYDRKSLCDTWDYYFKRI